jgi:23S rRNA (cytosine1962-C5)-methyltransferase
MPGLIVKPRSRILHGHDWVYASDVQKAFGNPQAGEVISLKDFKDRPLGTAIYNPKSQIVARRISRRKEELDEDFFERRVRRALALRERLPGLDPRLARIVWSEADGLPGVIVDRYGAHLVVQTLTLAMDRRKALLCDALRKVLEPESIVERNDSSVRQAEGLESATGMLHGDTPAPFRVETDGISFLVDLLGGQKTGLYLDQLGNYSAVAAWCAGKRVLDCFSNQGGFALAAARAGAAQVTAVDVSADAVAAIRGNAAASGVAEKVEAVEANVFDFLKEAEASGKSWDVVILDPPSFARSKKSLGDAMRGYKEIHLRALKLLQTGGILSTYCCSHHVSAAEFLEVICAAAVDAKRTLRQMASHSQRADHLVIPTLPETEYLKGFTFELMAGW